MMRLRLLLPALFVLLLVPAEGAMAATERSCAQRGSDTVAQNRYVRVYTLDGGGGDLLERLYACYRRTGRKVRIDEASSDDYVTEQSYSDVRLNGRFIAWVHEYTDISCKADCPPGYEPTSRTVRVFDARTRRERFTATDPFPRSLVVARNGVAAWAYGTGSSTYEIRVLRGRTQSTLDSGAIDPQSLRVDGLTLTWTNGGEQKSASLR